jgi:DNA-directed RNA polymerase I, II, and III subunit RPABC2
MSDNEDEYNSDVESVVDSEPEEEDEPDFQSNIIPNIKIENDENIYKSNYDGEGEGEDKEEGEEDEIGGEDEVEEEEVDEEHGLNEQFNINIGAHDLKYDDDDDDDNEEYLQKFNSEVNKNYILDFHPECMMHNYEEITAMSKIIKDDQGNIVDALHRTIPFLTKYERARILGQRAKQINSGAKVFVKVPEHVLDGYIIAEMELIEKTIPFIIRRPIAGGGCEYWNLRDLENIGF